jgi:hypothetical protein
MNAQIQHIERELSDSESLKSHQLYNNLSSIEDIQLFAKSHVLPLGFHVFTGKALQIN